MVALQYRIWAELIDGELAIASEPPENSMFSRAGRGTTRVLVAAHKKVKSCRSDFCSRQASHQPKATTKWSEQH